MSNVNQKYSTTKRVLKEKPDILKIGSDLYKTSLFIKSTGNKFDEGGLRKKGYYKQSKPDLPLVSVVTVVYNGEKYLEETIKSVIGQSYDNVEYIIVDGASKDTTLDIIKKYDEVIDYWISEPDKGIYDAMNKGISLCTGDIIKLINADDLLTEGSVSKAVQVYNDHTKDREFFISSYLEIMDVDGKSIAIWDDQGFTKYFQVFNHPGWYVPTRIYKKYGLYSTDFSISGDYEYFARLMSNRVEMVMIDVPLAKFRKDGSSSGFAGVFQVYEINKKYFSLVRAVYVFLMHGGIKLAGKIKKVLLTR
ncbi:glycosyltransferase family 2 protein [Sulfurovum sp. ST-21]|uniref:Glycosyltransferase n=1 Tax=Sulfurovum indicum TaxID=2779528 RepID=A0A7M1S6M0_9BACT|nr:glycosyltransferase family 2 protein [Sulfurovum indicum]QOR62621.1 glycosyltransferase [Sulfurovum indicum]